jgi:hypothetical protein
MITIHSQSAAGTQKNIFGTVFGVIYATPTWRKLNNFLLNSLLEFADRELTKKKSENRSRIRLLENITRF